MKVCLLFIRCVMFCGVYCKNATMDTPCGILHPARVCAGLNAFIRYPSAEGKNDAAMGAFSLSQQLPTLAAFLSFIYGAGIVTGALMILWAMRSKRSHP